MELVLPIPVIFITFYIAGVNVSGGTALHWQHGRCHPKCPARCHRLAKAEPRLALQLKKGGKKWFLRHGKSPRRWEAVRDPPCPPPLGDLPSLPRCLGVEDNFFFPLWGFHIICPYPDAVDLWCCSAELMKISPPWFSLPRKRFAYVFSCFCVYPFFP